MKWQRHEVLKKPKNYSPVNVKPTFKWGVFHLIPQENVDFLVNASPMECLLSSETFPM